MTVQVRHIEGEVLLRKLEERNGAQTERSFLLTEEEAISILAPMCPKCLKPVGEFPLALQEAKKFNRERKLERIHRLEEELKKLKESL